MFSRLTHGYVPPWQCSIIFLFPVSVFFFGGLLISLLLLHFCRELVYFFPPLVSGHCLNNQTLVQPTNSSMCYKVTQSLFLGLQILKLVVDDDDNYNPTIVKGGVYGLGWYRVCSYFGFLSNLIIVGLFWFVVASINNSFRDWKQLCL